MEAASTWKMPQTDKKKSQLHLPNKCVLNLALHACEMFQIQNLLVELGLCLNKNRVQTVLIPKGAKYGLCKEKELPVRLNQLNLNKHQTINQSRAQ